jgi:hypothetical protein
MLLVRAKEQCASCPAASQGRMPDGRALCVSCALVGAPVEAPLSDYGVPPRAEQNQAVQAAAAGLLAEASSRVNDVVIALKGKQATKDIGTLGAAREALRNWLTGAKMSVTGDALGAYNKFAAELVEAVRAKSAGAHGTASMFASRKVNVNGVRDAAYALSKAWKNAADIDAGGTFVAGHVFFAKAAAHKLLEALTPQFGRFGARELIIDALGPFGTARDSRLGRIVPRIGEHMGDDDELDDLADLFDPDSDLIGAAAAQMVDASLLRRARDALQKRTKGKRYDTVRLERELRKMFAADLRRNYELGFGASYMGAGVAGDLKNQRIVKESVGQSDSKWARFVALAGNEFYRSDAPKPAAKCRQTREKFVAANLGEPSYLDIAKELTNMASFLNKRAYEAKLVPGGADDDSTELTPAGPAKVVKDAEYRQVAQDLQRIRDSLIGDLNALCANDATDTKGKVIDAKPVDAKAIVDTALLTIFDIIWAQTVPHARQDVMNFAAIYSMYSKKPGSALQRRAAMVRDWLASRK